MMKSKGWISGQRSIGKIRGEDCFTFQVKSCASGWYARLIVGEIEIITGPTPSQDRAEKQLAENIYRLIAACTEEDDE